MGAGRLFCLCAVLAAPAAAELSPYQALSQGAGLELRDAFNRPVSRADVANRLKAAQRAEADAHASAAARAWVRFVEHAAALARAFRAERPAAGRSAVDSYPAPREPKVAHRTVLVRHWVAGAPARRCAAAPDSATPPDRALNLPLRC